MGQFPSTHWSLVNRAGEEANRTRLSALSSLITRYAPALKAHLIQRKRIHPDQADDLMQGFIASEMIEKNLLRDVHPSKGRLRSLLLTALDRYVINQFRYDTRRKRSAGNVVAIDNAIEPSDPNSLAPDDTFDIEWARQVLDGVLMRMEAECRDNGRDDVWGIFDARILAPLVRGEAPPAYEVMVGRLHIASAAQASNLLVTAKRMFVRALRGVIGEYALTDADIDAEIRDLQEILARGGARR